MTLSEKEKNLAKLIIKEAEKDLAKCGVKYEEYLKPKEPHTMNELLCRMLFHAQNGNGKYGIKFKEREADLAKILYDFSPQMIVKRYRSAEEIWREIPRDWKINDKGERPDWILYSKTIFESACLLKDFSTVQEVKETFTQVRNKFGKYYLPQLLTKIPGFGFAFSCDFLKEIGYEEYAKPDTHMITIIKQLFFGGDNKGAEEILKKIDDICEELKITQYHFDKLLFLVCTHEFYLDEGKVKKYGKTASQKKRNDFISLIEDLANKK